MSTYLQPQIYGALAATGASILEACVLQGSAQWEFMAKDLAAVNRSVTPWLVVGHHRPYYAPTVSLIARGFAASCLGPPNSST